MIKQALSIILGAAISITVSADENAEKTTKKDQLLERLQNMKERRQNHLEKVQDKKEEHKETGKLIKASLQAANEAVIKMTQA